MFNAAAGGDSAITIAAVACIAWALYYGSHAYVARKGGYEGQCLSCAEYGSWRGGCCARPCGRPHQHPCAAAAAAPAPQAALSLVRPEFLPTSQPSFGCLLEGRAASSSRDMSGPLFSRLNYRCSVRRVQGGPVLAEHVSAVLLLGALGHFQETACHNWGCASIA